MLISFGQQLLMTVWMQMSTERSARLGLELCSAGLGHGAETSDNLNPIGH